MAKITSITGPEQKVLTRAQKDLEIRAKYGKNTIVLCEHSKDYYEAYGESAEELHKHLELAIIYFGDTPVAEIKHDCQFWVFPRLIRNGFKICIYDSKDY